MSVKVEVNFDGLEKLQKKLENMSEKQEISFGDLFNDNFMSQYTNVSSFDELIEVGGFVVNSAEDFKQIPDDKWELCIQENTSFDSWEEMQSKAAAEHVRKQLFG